jgi:predicted  nucleic acid-binding Zn-ribbon protein
LITASNGQNSKNAKRIQDSLNLAPIVFQYQEMVKKSNPFQEYKVIKQTYLKTFGDNLTDSIASLKTNISSLSVELENQKKEIENLNSQIDLKAVQISNLEKEKEGFDLMGVLIDKNTYTTVVYSILAILVTSLVVIGVRHKKSHEITQKSIADLQELQEEFETHRKTALKREQKVMRKLQDEINKQK